MAIFLPHDLPTVRCFDGDCKGGAEFAGLVGSIENDGLGDRPEIEDALIGFNAVDLHLIGYVAPGRVELPVTDKGIGCR